MPMAEDPMNDVHTRIAQARFEKELLDAESFGPTGVFFGALGGVFLVGVAMPVYVFVCGLAVAVFPLFFLTQKHQRKSLILTSLKTLAWVLGITVIISLVGWMLGYWNGQSLWKFWKTTTTLQSDWVRGIGVFDPVSRDSNFTTPRQFFFVLMGTPLLVALLRHARPVINAIDAVLDWIDTLAGTRRFDDVRAIVHGPPPLKNITPESDQKRTEQSNHFGHARYESKPGAFVWDDIRDFIRAELRGFKGAYTLDNAHAFANTMATAYEENALRFTEKFLNNLKATQANQPHISFLQTALAILGRRARNAG